MKILVIVNEDLEEMILGKSTTLAYIFAAVNLGFDVFVYKILADGNILDLAEVFYLNKNNSVALVDKYKSENHKIVDGLLGLNNQASSNISVNDFCISAQILLQKKDILLSKIDFIIQRLEPMKAPFPPIGTTSINNFLLRLKKLFPQKFVFNFPINAYADKELPLVFSQDEVDLATPTAVSFYGDSEMPEKLQKIAKKYSEIFATNQQKIVLKPDDSAQAFGVFALDIADDGLNLAQIKQKTIAELSKIQLYKVNASNDWNDISEIINILCFVQSCKAQKILDHQKIIDIDLLKIKEMINSLYGNKILIQPFLEGIKLGDIRINLAKMSDGNFKVVGAVFRKSISYDEKNFTTCLTGGASSAQAVEASLSQEEMRKLIKKVHLILHKLNQDKAIKSRYIETTEIGCDFLLVGNGSDIYFGEANHHCPALIPFSESLEKAQKTNFYDEISGLRVDYDGGLAIVGEIIKQQIALQG